MPELPEVEFGRGVFETLAVGRTIVDVEAASDAIVFCGLAPDAFVDALRGREVHAVHRRGKYIWAELDVRPWPVFHFGMTGAFRTRGVLPLKYRSHGAKVDDEWPPRFAKLRLTFDDDSGLVFTNARRLGRVRLAIDPPTEPPIRDLGFDPLVAMVDLREFRRLLARRTAVLKALLLDQGFCAGIGNWIADEVLYQARIAPGRRPNQLSAAEVGALHKAIKKVITVAVGADARKDRLPRGWLFHRRWGKNPDAVDAHGHRLRFGNFGGRTTAWVPARQR